MKSWIPRSAFAVLAIIAIAGPVAVVRGSAPSIDPPAAGSAEEAIALMFEGFANRSWQRYVHAMAEDFLFTSDDPDHVAKYPNGMTREDEQAFAQHLFEGGGRGPCGEPLAIATSVDVVAGPMVVIPAAAGAKRLVLEVLSSRILLENGEVMDVGPTLNTIDVVLTEAGWRVTRWHETIEATDANRSAMTATAGEYTALPRSGHGVKWVPKGRLAEVTP